jgi:LysM repeat protein
MIMKRFLLFLTIALVVIGSTGCKMPASTAPAGTPVSGTLPVPAGESTETMGLFEDIATQTAQAQQGGGAPQGAVTDTPQPQAVTPTAGGGNAGNSGGGQQPTQPSAPKPTATKAPAIVVPTSTPGLPQSYTLQKGEFPYCIARRFNVNPSELLSLNGLNANSMVHPGQSLKIPQTGHTFPGNRMLINHPATYTVKSGDTIYTIACAYGDVEPSAIAIANGLSSPYTLSSGQTLHIP